MVAQIWEPSTNGERNRLTIDQQGKISIIYSDIKPYSNMTKLLSSLRRLGGYSMASLASSPPPSWGFHHAGTLPMKDRPDLFETHADGRLWNSKRVRIIDGSVLPSLPAKNLSLTIMANSARIAEITKSCGY
jgi:choline dehydrogenase-like flavoprotein